MSKEENKKILIVGGGVAGCVALCECVKKGFDVVLCESASSPGGRMNSRNDRVTGDQVDNGQHLIMGAYHVFLSFIDDLGLMSSLDIQDKLRVPSLRDGKEICLEKKVKGQIGTLGAILFLEELSLLDKLLAMKMIAKLRLGILKYAGKTCGELFGAEDQNERVVEILWEPVILATLNTKAAMASAELFAEVIKQVFLGNDFNSNMIIPKCGLNNLFSPLENWTKENTKDNQRVEILLNTTVKSLIFEDGKCVGIRTAKAEEIYADFIITTLPPDRTSKLLQNVKVEAEVKTNVEKLLNELDFSPIISVYLWLDKIFLEEKMLGLLNTQTQWIFSKRNNRVKSANTKEYPEFISATISAGDVLMKMPSGDLANLCLEDIQRNIAKAKNAKLLHYKVIRQKHATISQTPRTDEIRKNIQRINLEENNNLLLAGDWTWTGLPATIESAAISGRDAAARINNSN